MRFIVYGAGAVGSSVGGYLAHAQHKVILIGRADHVAGINSEGLSLKDANGTVHISIEARTSIEDVCEGPDDVIFLCVKSQDTAQAVARVKAWTMSDPSIFCFQNGVRNEEEAARTFSNVYGVHVGVGVRYLRPGVIVHYSPKAFTLGRYPEGLDNLTNVVGDALRSAGYQVTLSSNVMAAKWSKLMMNLSNAFYAVTGLSILEGRNMPEARAFVADLFEEGTTVLEAAGIKYDPITDRLSPRETVERLREASPARPLPEDPDFYHYPSTWQDLQLQRGTTEVASFNGEIIALGSKNGVATPINELLQRLVEEMAANKELPGKYTVAQLRAMLG